MLFCCCCCCCCCKSCASCCCFCLWWADNASCSFWSVAIAEMRVHSSESCFWSVAIAEMRVHSSESWFWSVASTEIYWNTNTLITKCPEFAVNMLLIAGPNASMFVFSKAWNLFMPYAYACILLFQSRSTHIPHKNSVKAGMVHAIISNKLFMQKKNPKWTEQKTWTWVVHRLAVDHMYSNNVASVAHPSVDNAAAPADDSSNGSRHMLNNTRKSYSATCYYLSTNLCNNI